MKAFLADTNFFLRFLLRDIESQHKETKKYLNQAKQNKITIVVPQIVIFELVFTLEKYYLFPKKEVVDKLKAVLGASYLKVQDKLVLDKAVELFVVLNISFTDCFLLSQIEFTGMELLTFDKKLKKTSEGLKA